jgi:chain length determinant protein (polysaccharide antigen chain regulator)
MSSNAQDANNDGISIIDVILLLLNRKKIIFWIMTVVVCVGLFYALSIKRVYQAEAIITPPTFEHVKPLNLLDKNLTTASVFKAFLQVVESRKLKKEFFENNNILDVYLKNSDDTPSVKDINKAFESFSKSIKVNINKKSNFVKVTLESIDKNKVDIWLDDFIKIAGQETVDQLVTNLELNLDLKIKRLNNNILSKRTIYSKKYLDEINRLQENYQLAKVLGIEEQSDASNLLLNTSSLTDYMRGAKILKAEINILKSRDISKFNIAGIRDLEEEIINLKFLKIDKKTVKTIYIDTKAVGTTNIVRPDRRFIVMFSFIFGGFLAILVVFIIEFNNYIKRKRVLKTIQI